MTLVIVDTIRVYLGWCPNARPTAVSAPRGDAPSRAGIFPDTPQPGTTPLVPGDPRWMTAVSIAILFATLFVGGNFWWPAFVFVVLVIFVIIHIRSLQARRGS